MQRVVAGMTMLMCLGLLPGARCSAETTTPEFTVWAYSLFKSNVSRNVVQPFFDQLAAQTGDRFRIVTSNRSEDYLKSCQSGDPAIVMAPYPIAKQFMKACAYEVVAVTHQTYQLFVRNNIPNPTPAGIHKLATVRGTHAAIVGPEELTPLNDHFDLVLYADIYNLIKNYRADKVDGIVFNTGMLHSIRSMENQWKPIMNFKQQGKAFALLSSTLPPRFKATYTRLLLEKGGVSTAVFVDKMSLGGFEAPAPEELAQLKN